MGIIMGSGYGKCVFIGGHALIHGLTDRHSNIDRTFSTLGKRWGEREGGCSLGSLFLHQHALLLIILLI